MSFVQALSEFSFARLCDLIIEGPQELRLAAYLFVATILGAVASIFIPLRSESDYWWGPSRFFALVKRKSKWMGEPGAYLWTETMSGLLHVPTGYLLGYMASPILGPEGSPTTPARWAAGIVFVFWFGVGVGRASQSARALKLDTKTAHKSPA